MRVEKRIDEIMGGFVGVIVMRGREERGGFEMGSWEGIIRKEEFRGGFFTGIVRILWTKEL